MRAVFATFALVLFSMLGTSAFALPPEGGGPGDNKSECSFDASLDCYFMGMAEETVYQAGAYGSCRTVYEVDIYQYDCQSNGPRCTYRDRDPDPVYNSCE